MDQIARDKASDASHAVNNHIAITGVKLDQLDKKIDNTHGETNTKIDRLESILKWAGGLIVMLFISTLTWSLAQQYNANESTKKDLQAQVELLREQQRSSVTAATERQQIMTRLNGSGGAQPAVPPAAIGE